MKRIKPFKSNHFWIAVSLLFLGVSAFASDRMSHESAVNTSKSDCVTCSPDVATGGPLSGNKLANAMEKVSRQLQSEENSLFMGNIFSFCGILTIIDTEKEFKTRIIAKMEEFTPDDNINRYWLETGCITRYSGNSQSPLIHVTAENSTERLIFLVMLKKYLSDKNDLATFNKIINLKNTDGMTTMDYIQYMVDHNKLIKEEEAGLNKYVNFMCKNGAVYSKYNKKCPAEYIKIKTNY